VNEGPLDPFNLHGDLDDARRRYTDAVSSLRTAQGQLMELSQSRATLEARRSTQNQLQAEMPSLQTDAATTESRCIMLQSQFSVLKDASAKLDLKVREVQGDALVTKSTAYTKDEFVAGLLEMCNDALIDARLTDEVQMIKGEIFEEYGGPIPDEIAEAGYAVEEKLKVLSTLPSIKALL
jgi:chromosome segregation ATPase